MAHAEQIATLLVELEDQLRQLGLWESNSPAAAALASTQPFCIDTLSFTQWLQFVFLPRMHSLLERQQPLPAGSGIAPMAQEYFAKLDVPSAALEYTLQAIDSALSV